MCCDERSIWWSDVEDEMGCWDDWSGERKKNKRHKGKGGGGFVINVWLGLDKMRQFRVSDGYNLS